MWKFLEQRSFHLSESEYTQQLDAVAEYLTLWRVAPNVRAGIRSATPRGPGYTGGGGARAVSTLLVISPAHALRCKWWYKQFYVWSLLCESIMHCILTAPALFVCDNISNPEDVSPHSHAGEHCSECRHRWRQKQRVGQLLIAAGGMRRNADLVLLYHQYSMLRHTLKERTLYLRLTCVAGGI